MRRKSVLGLVTALVLSAAGCSFGQADPGDQASSAAADPASTAPSSSTPPTPADPGQPAGPDQLGQPVATRASATDGKRIELTLYPVLRDGAVSHVNLVLSAPDEGTERVQISTVLDDSDLSASDNTGDTADGLQLVDGKNKKLYLVASDSRNHCLCSRGLNNVYVDYGKPVLLSAAFAAPPADLSAIQVRIPNFGTFKNVPVQ